MTKITEFTRETLKDLRPEIQAVLDMIRDEYGVRMEIGGISFQKGKFTTRLTGYCGENAEKSQVDHHLEGYEQTFNLFCTSYGLQKEHLGKTVQLDGKGYSIVGLNRKSAKYPIMTMREDGKLFKFGVVMTRQLLGIKAPIFYRFGHWVEDNK